MVPVVQLVRLNSVDIANAIRNNDDDLEEILAADYAPEVENDIDSSTDSEEDAVIDDGDSDMDAESDTGDEDEQAEYVAYVAKDGTVWESMPVPTPRETTRARKSLLKKVNIPRGQHFETPVLMCFINFATLTVRNEVPDDGQWLFS